MENLSAYLRLSKMKNLLEKFDDDKFNYIKSVKLQTGLSWRHFIFIMTVFFDKYHDKMPVDITPNVTELLDNDKTK